jgi:hypothetical protein
MMKPLFYKLAMPLSILAWVFASVNANAATCATSASSLYGWYAMLVSGTTGNVSAKYLVGAILFDGVSQLTGNNVYGSGSDSTVTGTYALNADCTLTIQMNIGSTAQVYTVAMKTSNEAVGIEVDSSAVATIDLQAQYATYTPGLNFTNSSANGLFTGVCYGAAGATSDVNIASFSNGSVSGTDPYNNGGSGGSLQVANNPYTGTYTVNSDGTFSGTVSVDGYSFAFYGVIANGGTELEYFYTDVASGTLPGAAFEGCVDKL